AHMVQAQRALSQAHYRALAALALNLDPVPRHLQDLRHLILARMEGLLDRERFRSGIHTLLEHYRRAYQQLLDADRMASRWQAQHQEDLGEIMRSLEEAYLGGMDCLESLLEGGVAEAEALWPRLVSSFRSIQETRRQIARLEERLGPIDFLEPDPFSY
ncbi:MAG TPA: hypothetical protein VNO81_07205, partial [Candidatus Nitrosotenuis sp.]|nr:hypothetical protein [Candidatus Nitrosotenuis sp.]